MLQQIASNLHKLRHTNPLIHNITNVVVTNFTANGLLALGASPVMAYAPEEVADMAKIAGALVLNIGTLNEAEIKAMIIAAQSANLVGVPVILDPVGAGATPYRTATAQKILREVQVSLVRGNAAEVANVIGERWQIKGVDAGAGSGSTAELAQLAASKLNTVVVVTGKQDVVASADNTYVIGNGHPLLTRVTGTGCLLTSVIGGFAAIDSNLPFAAASALVVYGVAAELAAQLVNDAGPGSFQIELLNQLSKVSAEDIVEYGSIETI